MMICIKYSEHYLNKKVKKKKIFTCLFRYCVCVLLIQFHWRKANKNF